MQLHLVRRTPSPQNASMATSVTGPGRRHRVRPGGRLTPVRTPGDRSAGVVAAALDPDTFCSAVSAHLNVPNGMDGAEHTLYRAVADKYMTRERTAAIESICQAVAAKLLAEIHPARSAGGRGGRAGASLRCVGAKLVAWLALRAGRTPVGMDG